MAAHGSSVFSASASFAASGRTDTSGLRGATNSFSSASTYSKSGRAKGASAASEGVVHNAAAAVGRGASEAGSGRGADVGGEDRGGAVDGVDDVVYAGAVGAAGGAVVVDEGSGCVSSASTG